MTIEEQRLKNTEKGRRYRAKNPEAMAEIQRRWRKNHPDRARASQRRYNAKHPGHKTPYGRRYRAEHPEIAAWSFYRVNAKKRGLIFDLSKDDFNRLLLAPCEYCGALSNPIGGIDRVDNGVGYIAGNIVPCCTVCNLAKRNQTKEEFLDWAMRVATRIGG